MPQAGGAGYPPVQTGGALRSGCPPPDTVTKRNRLSECPYRERRSTACSLHDLHMALWLLGFKMDLIDRAGRPVPEDSSTEMRSCKRHMPSVPPLLIRITRE
jgi:hypothetical protein